MKEATGELNMTVITIVAIAAVGALFYLFVWPMIQKSIVTQTCKTYGNDWQAWATTETSVNGTSTDTGSNAKVKVWVCCPSTVTAAPANKTAGRTAGCVDANYN